MQLESVKIKGFRSIRDAQTLAVEPGITCIVGKSEVGKTNILRAIDFAFSPSTLNSEDRCESYHDETDYEVVALTFTLDDEDNKVFSSLELKSPVRKITFAKHKSGKIEFAFSPVNLGSRKIVYRPEFKNKIASARRKLITLLRLIKELRSRLSAVMTEALGLEINSYYDELFDLAVTQRKLNIRDYKEEEDIKAILPHITAKLINIYGILKPLKNISSIKYRMTHLINRLEQLQSFDHLERLTVSPINDEAMKGLLPKLIYLKDQDLITIQPKATRKDLQDPKFAIFKCILDLSAVSAEVIGSDNTVEVAKANIKMSTALDKIIAKYWSQENISIIPSIHGSEIVLLLKGEEEFISNPSARSEGFRWFLSFILRYLTTVRTKDVLVLVDEPGLHLHASGQKDLIRILYDLPKSVQFIYTTHSQYMMPKSFPGKTRSISKPSLLGQYSTSAITQIDNKPYRLIERRSWEPIRSAIGLELGDSLFLGGRNILVEGVSDQIILSAFAHYINKKENKLIFNLDDTNFVPFHNDKAICMALCEILNREGIPFIILLDNDKSGEATFSYLIKKSIDKNLILWVSPEKPSELEDLFVWETLCKSITTFYASIDKKLKLTDTKEKMVGDKRKNEFGITRHIKEYMNKHYQIEMDKIGLAKQLANNIIAEDVSINTKDIRRFSALLHKIFMAVPLRSDAK